MKTIVTFTLLFYTSMSWSKTTVDSATSNTAIDKNKTISGELDKTANIIDRFLSRQKYTSEKNQTTLTIDNSIRWLDGEDIKYKPRVKLDLHLPNLEKKWKLRLTNYDEEKEDEGISKNRLKTQAPKEKYGLSASFVKNFDKVETTFRPRLEFKDTLLTSFLIRTETKLEKKHFVFLPKLEFFGKPGTGMGQFAAINFDFPINETFSFYLINEEEYTNVEQNLQVTHGMGLVHYYNDRMSQNYRLNFEYEKKPAYHLSRYTFASEFSHQVYRRVLHYSITPFVVWDEQKQFSGRFGTEVAIEFIF